MDDETLTMSRTVVANPVKVSPVIKPPAVAPFQYQIDVPPPMPLPLPPQSPPYVPPTVPPPLPPEPIPLILPPPYPSDSVADKEDDLVVEFHKKKWKEYLEGT